ncbi:hypothetical protein [Pseudomonas syringae]|uniref:hypothetical protein n=1 Tax=Pseudomonas syringae TaxID=317 RepID=UPI001D047110|nr:hypothetical protein [Pseudomonas syringae]MCK9733894.1 hypothetical protein [Pseudomonas syringae pv. syringae]
MTILITLAFVSARLIPDVVLSLVRDSSSHKSAVDEAMQAGSLARNCPVWSPSFPWLSTWLGNRPVRAAIQAAKPYASVPNDVAAMVWQLP